MNSPESMPVINTNPRAFVTPIKEEDPSVLDHIVTGIALVRLGLCVIGLIAMFVLLIAEMR